MSTDDNKEYIELPALPEGMEISVALYCTNGEVDAVLRMTGLRRLQKKPDLASMRLPDGFRLMTKAEIAEYKKNDGEHTLQ